MTVRVVSRLERMLLECWGCMQQFKMDADPGLSMEDNVFDLVMAARKEGWVARRYADDVFALCPSCVQADLARLLMSLYVRDGESRSGPDSPSARGPDGARAPSGLWRRVKSILRLNRTTCGGWE